MHRLRVANRNEDAGQDPEMAGTWGFSLFQPLDFSIQASGAPDHALEHRILSCEDSER